MATLLVYAAGLIIAFIVLAIVALFLLVDRDSEDKESRD